MTDAAVAEARAAREAAWLTHADRLDAGTAGQFRAALDHEDALTSRRFEQLRESAALRQIEFDILRLTGEVARAEEIHRAEWTPPRQPRAAFSALVADCWHGLPDGMDFPAFEAWCQAA